MLLFFKVFLFKKAFACLLVHGNGVQNYFGASSHPYFKPIIVIKSLGLSRRNVFFNCIVLCPIFSYFFIFNWLLLILVFCFGFGFGFVPRPSWTKLYISFCTNSICLILLIILLIRNPKLYLVIKFILRILRTTAVKPGDSQTSVQGVRLGGDFAQPCHNKMTPPHHIQEGMAWNLTYSVEIYKPKTTKMPKGRMCSKVCKLKKVFICKRNGREWIKSSK